MSVCMKTGMAETQWSIDWLLLRLHVLLELWTLYVNSKALTSFRFCPKAKYLADKCVWSRCICLHVARVSLKACMCAMSTCVWTAVWVWESEALGGHLQTERLFSQAPASHSPLTVPGSTLKTLAFPHADIFKETFEILQTCMLMHLIVRSDLRTSTKGLCGRVDLQREIYPARRSQRVGSSRAAHAPV